MVSAGTAVGRLGSNPPSAAQTRILIAALDLFAEHGVSATSLQMIADAVGVTKAAVYHQFKTKDEIIVAVTEMQLARLEDALEAAENRPQARELLLKRVIDMAVEERHMVSLLQFDPVIARSTRYTLKDHGMEWDNSGKNAFYSRFAYEGDSRL